MNPTAKALAISATLSAVLAILPPQAQAQNTYTWSTTTTSTSWLNSGNWTGGALNKFPGVDLTAASTADGNAGDTAVFGTLAFSGSSLGINFNSTSSNTGNGNNANASGSLTLGGMEFSSTLSKDFSLGKSDSSAFAATLTLGGATINSVANVVLRNNDNNNVTFAGFAGGSGSFPMSLALGNATENIINVDSSGNIVLSTNIISSSGTTPLTVGGSGSGRVDVNGTANTWTGNIKLTGAEVRFTADGSLGNSANTVTVDGGRLAIVSGGSVDLSLRSIFLGATAGTSISAPGGSGTLIYNG